MRRFSSLSPGEYLTTLLRPIADLFNQLHSPRVLRTPMECISIAFGESVYGVTFMAEDFKTHLVTSPIILSLPDNLFDSKGTITPRVEYALSKALEYKPSAPSIIMTNFEDIAVFHPRAWNSLELGFEKISTTLPPLALRVISTAYLQCALGHWGYINTPDPNMEVDNTLILPEGPPQDPNQPLLPDEQIFATYHRHSDFDIETLVRNRARALQFFRWQEEVQRRYSKVVAHPNDTLTALTNQVGQIIPDVHPLYPYDASKIPADTAEHLASIQRESPLVTADLGESLKRSKTFTLKIQSILAEGSPGGICTVYRCQITSIDKTPVSSPSLCLKLFDDRFQLLRRPDEDDEQLDETLPRWFDLFAIAEMYAVNEAFAYEKLRPVQGSVVPWFYGTHQFTLPDGTVLYGLLMEYIEGFDLKPNFVRTLSTEQQIDMIRSCRHAARVLDVADVSQRDWHSGQILLHTNPKTKRDHAVLVDFASTTQTWALDKLNYIANYRGILQILLGGEGNGFNTELVWKHYGEPDDWDSLRFIRGGRPWDKEDRVVTARDMFLYISSA